MAIIESNILRNKYIRKKLFIFFVASLLKVCRFNSKKYEYKAEEKDAVVVNETFISQCLNQKDQISTQRFVNSL